MIKWFDSYEVLIDCIKRFEKYFTQCKNCGFIWLNPQVNYLETMSESEFVLLGKCLVDLNSWCPDVDELKESKVFISHGACKLCNREALKPIYRGRQCKEGNPDCYGKANDGDCNREDCIYRRLYCIVPRFEHDEWLGRIRRLIEVIPLELYPEEVVQVVH